MLNSHSRETVFPPCPIAHDGEQEIDSSRFAYEAISPERMQITKQKNKKNLRNSAHPLSPQLQLAPLGMRAGRLR